MGRLAKAIWAVLLAVAAPAAVTTAAMAQPVSAVNPDFLYGRWTDVGDCSNAVDFHPDGRFVTTAGAQGRWWLQGGRLYFRGTSELSARIHAPDRDTVVLTHDDGSVGRSTRCPAAAAAQRPTMPPLPANEAEALRISRPIDAAFLIGRWTDDGDCTNAMRFSADGGFVLPGGGTGRWTLAGERLTFIGNSTAAARVRAVGNDRIILIHDDYSLGQSLRC